MHTSIADALVNGFGFDNPTVEDAGLGQGQTRRLIVTVGDQKFMAKHFGDGSETGLANLEFECLLLACLRAAKISAARNLPARSGRAFAIVENRPLMVYEWAEGGVEWPASSEKAFALGSTLAEMHLASDGLVLTGSERTYDIARLTDRPLALLEPYAADHNEFTNLGRLTEVYKAQMAAIPIEAPYFGPIHGDIHQGNCHFQDDGRLTILDFALCGVGYRAYDLTGFLWPMRDKTIEDQKMRTCCEAFLDGYESVRPLHPAEKLAIPAFVQIRSLWESGDWVDTGTGTQQPNEVATTIPYLLKQFSAVS